MKFFATMLVAITGVVGACAAIGSLLVAVLQYRRREAAPDLVIRRDVNKSGDDVAGGSTRHRQQPNLRALRANREKRMLDACVAAAGLVVLAVVLYLVAYNHGVYDHRHDVLLATVDTIRVFAGVAAFMVVVVGITLWWLAQALRRPRAVCLAGSVVTTGLLLLVANSQIPSAS